MSNDKDIPNYTQEQIDEAGKKVLGLLSCCDGVKKTYMSRFIQVHVDSEIFDFNTDYQLATWIARYIHRLLCYALLRSMEDEDTFLIRLQLDKFRKITPKEYWQDKTWRELHVADKDTYISTTNVMLETFEPKDKADENK